MRSERADTELVFVMGADAAVGLESWREPERVVELARLAVARRAGVSDAEVAAVMRSLGAEGRATMLEMPQFGVSSSAVRERAAAGRPLRYLVPEAGGALHRGEGDLLVSEFDSEALARRLAELADSKGAERDRRPRHARASSPTPTSWRSARRATSARRGRSSTR